MEICFWKLAENGKNSSNKYKRKGPALAIFILMDYLWA